MTYLLQITFRRRLHDLTASYRRPCERDLIYVRVRCQRSSSDATHRWYCIDDTRRESGYRVGLKIHKTLLQGLDAPSLFD